MMLRSPSNDIIVDYCIISYIITTLFKNTCNLKIYLYIYIYTSVMGVTLSYNLKD